MRWAVLVVAAVVAVWVAYSSLYSPLSTGSFSAPETRSVKALTDGVAPTRYIVDAAAGQQGRIAYDVGNDGRFPVRVDGLASDHPYGITAVGWVPPAGNGGLFGGHASDVRDFPVTIKPGEWVVLWVTVTKPRCQEGQNSGIEEIPLRWSALGRHHVYKLRLSDSAGGVREIALCHPSDALRHLEFPES
ncbi:hypothetical protein SAMN05421678_106146 [Actinopolymorpha cephalotaxi]|uniref:Uncharacterized protein n=1 Tax=Actinopolymorpha cephalotaxi TaxID=504797 RepID=A0A1I2S8K1_9ACTN|nr:hypothetical protein [Actinopolymorpha cephalotaxi]NYH87071.1 hypothetical protein [Actinopolymorpha cephalotaxi]SFG49234.1 hypothetical protein SAMN05421678_106146 [Actinopolymorpha cephalotaxi]